MTNVKEITNRLNELLTKNYDAEAGYKKAAENVKNIELKQFFQKRAEDRYDFGHELKNEIRNFGEEPNKGTSLAGDAHRFWMDVKTTFTSENEEAILEEAIRGEKASVEEYNDVIANATLPPSTESILLKQRQSVEKALDNVQIMEINA